MKQHFKRNSVDKTDAFSVSYITHNKTSISTMVITEFSLGDPAKRDSKVKTNIIINKAIKSPPEYQNI